MADVTTPEQRHRCMAAVKGKDTRPEIIVRRYLFSKGLRYRVNNRKLPGSPDIVLKKYKTAVFVDGCFWHGHEGCVFFKMPKSNQDYWERKISHNRARDISNTFVLQKMGWRVIRVWECDVVSSSKRSSTLESIYNQIMGEVPLPKIELRPLLFESSTAMNTYDALPDDSLPMAAEPSEDY